MPSQNPARTAFSGGGGLAAARDLSTAAAAREAKVGGASAAATGGSKVAESKARASSVDEKVSHEEEKASIAAAAPGPRAGAASAESKSARAVGRRHEEGEVMLPQTIKAQRIMDGFRIVRMNMSDAHTGEVIWESSKWEGEDFERELKAYVPKRILACKEVAREITFASKHLMNNFRLEQRVYFQGTCIEEWLFEFGFVIPGSKNTWQQSIEAADEMFPAEVLSGNITFETSFFDADMLISKSIVRVYYVD